MNALVTGGGGFLGGAIVRRLVARGDHVRSLSRRRYPELDALDVEQIQGDVADLNSTQSAVQGSDVVFHVAAKAGVWGPYADYHRANVVGTQNVVAACRKHGVRRLVYTSSPSVVFDGRDLEGVDESMPYPKQYDAAYPQTKAEAERFVLAANGADLATVALRPHLIWGPGDNHLIPRILERGRAGRLRRVGRANKLIDSIYIDNAADAHCWRPIASARFAHRRQGLFPVERRADSFMGSDQSHFGDARHCAGDAHCSPMARVHGRLVAGRTYMILGRREEPPMMRFLARN